MQHACSASSLAEALRHAIAQHDLEYESFRRWQAPLDLITCEAFAPSAERLRRMAAKRHAMVATHTELTSLQRSTVMSRDQAASIWPCLPAWLPMLFPREPEGQQPTPATIITDSAQLARREAELQPEGRKAEHNTQWFDMAAEDDESGTPLSFSSKCVSANSLLTILCLLTPGPPNPQQQ